MGSGTRGREGLGPTRPKRGRRKREVYVYSEGKVTERDYIQVVRERVAETGVELSVDVHHMNTKDKDDSDREPLQLVELAVATLRQKTREARRALVKPEFWPEVWCLFDRDQHEGIETAFSRAERAGVRVAFSHPCFEVWRLLHHKDVSGTFGGVCGLAAKRLPFAGNATNIKAVLPEQIPPGSFEQAKKRARRMNAQHGDHLPRSRRDPYTDVYTFVEEGLGIASY